MRDAWGPARIAGHTLFWLGLSLYAFSAAAHSKFASCWTILLSLFPPLIIPFLTVAILSLAYFAISIFRPSWRTGRAFKLALHGSVLSMGLAATVFAARAAAGPVHCL